MTDDNAYFLFSGALFGLSAGIAPGPLLALVISQTLRFGAKEGVKVAASPLITDIPIIACAALVSLSLAAVGPVLGALSMAGAVYVCYLGWSTAAMDVDQVAAVERSVHSIRKGVLVNALNPHPYIFWFTVGGPILYRANKHSTVIALLFLVLFYTGLVGVKILLAQGIGRYKAYITKSVLAWITRLLGLLLVILALLMVRDGIRLMAS